MMERIEKIYREIMPEADYSSMRLVRMKSEYLRVRQNVLQPTITSDEMGVMFTVMKNGGMGYAGTCDLTKTGLEEAMNRALKWAEYSASQSLVDYSKIDYNAPVGEYTSRIQKPWETTSLKDKIDFLFKVNKAQKINDKIVDWNVSLARDERETLYVSSNGGRVFQRIASFMPDLEVTANEGSETITRSGGFSGLKQGGLEILDDMEFEKTAVTLAEEACELLKAPNCPSGKMDALLDPGQMVLQIHESVGHPLEMDRILGDERNYAGTTFVTPDMIGSYQYGSEHLNITYDPTVQGELVSYAFDDDGQPAEKQFIIEKGILKRALGSITSQTRSGLPGVANSRANSWNRHPIDRMVNLNLEPGTSSLKEMISSIEKGVFMKTNCSWSIDDSRNKFQFGCEWGQMIENGELTNVVKKPNYRGISENFWRSLKMVGNKDTFVVSGVTNCGKGEPNQDVFVGHASPVCLFSNIDVFGGE